MPSSFADACDAVERALGLRPDIVRDGSRTAQCRPALLRLRKAMQINTWEAGARTANLAPIVSAYDARTTGEGFHVLRDWDGRADAVLADTIPIDVLNYLIAQRGDEATNATAIAILLDYYFFYVLVLLSVRIWDEGHPDASLDRVNDLLERLQGPDGSGHRFAGDAGTLLLLAGSHYELRAAAYDRLLDKVRELAPRHQRAVAFSHATSLGSHLRFGFEATYGRDVGAMRADNVPDYPWLCFALVTLVREYTALHDAGTIDRRRAIVVEAIINGLSPDPGAFLSDPVPAALASCVAEREELRDALRRHRDDLLSEAERHRPADRAYSPLSFYFNFSHNVVKGTVVDALLWGEPRMVSLNDLLSGVPRSGDEDAAKQALAGTLMTYARAHPHTIRGRATPVIVYDPASGRQAFGGVMRMLGNTR